LVAVEEMVDLVVVLYQVITLQTKHIIVHQQVVDQVDQVDKQEVEQVVLEVVPHGAEIHLLVQEVLEYQDSQTQAVAVALAVAVDMLAVIHMDILKVVHLALKVRVVLELL
jgi:hypothetical protein